MRFVSRALAAPALLLLLGVGLAGCVTSNAGSTAMDARAEALTPSASRVYMPVEEMPSNRAPALTTDEQSKLRKELTAVRDRQTLAGKTQRGR